MEEVKSIQELKQKFSNDDLEEIVNNIKSVREDKIYSWLEINGFDPTDVEYQNIDCSDYVDECYLSIYNDLMNVFEQTYNLEINDDVCEELSSEFLCEYPNNAYFMGALKSAKIKYKQAYKDVFNSVEKEFVNDFDDLHDYNDSVGVTTKIKDRTHIDYDNREGAFVYADGKFMLGGEGQTHSEIIMHYLQKHQDEYDVDVDTNGINRLTDKKMEDIGFENFAFGHIYYDMAFVDSIVGNVDEGDLVSKCKSKAKVIKVYFLDRENDSVTRLSKYKKYMA